jgi:hypothetical protein
VIAAVAEWLFSNRIYLEHDRPYAHGAVLHERALLGLTLLTVVAAAASLVLALAA